MTVGREYHILMNKDANFYSHWCNDDMVYNDTEDGMKLEAIKFEKDDENLAEKDD